MQLDRWRADRLDTRLLQGRLTAQNLRAVAHELVGFHRGTPAGGGSEAAAAAVASLTERVDALRGRSDAGVLEASQVAVALGSLERAMEVEAGSIGARANAGAIRRAHGGFGPDAAYVDSASRASLVQPPRAFAADVAFDVARMAVTLRRAARCDLAESFVAAYAEAADDFALYRVLACYERLHALEQAVAAAERADAAQWLALASSSRSARRAQLVAVGGRAASGKTTVARRLAAELGAPLVSADPLRAQAADGWSLFLALAARAVPVLDSGRSVVIDASFAAQAMRRGAARLARERGLAFVFTECRARPSALSRRLAGAGEAPAQQEWEPVRELECGVHIVIDTTRAEPSGFARVRRMLPARTAFVA